MVRIRGASLNPSPRNSKRKSANMHPRSCEVQNLQSGERLRASWTAPPLSNHQMNKDGHLSTDETHRTSVSKESENKQPSSQYSTTTMSDEYYALRGNNDSGTDPMLAFILFTVMISAFLCLLFVVIPIIAMCGSGCGDEEEMQRNRVAEEEKRRRERINPERVKQKMVSSRLDQCPPLVMLLLVLTVCILCWLNVVILPDTDTGAFCKASRH